MSKPFYVATSIVYANGPLHIGHCYESVYADAIARYQRLRGREVFFLTGTDEHGIKIERTAAAAGRTPQEWVDAVSGGDRALFDRLAVSYDDFIRTTEERHRVQVQAIFTRLCQQGDIYLDRYQGWYCQYEESFWPPGRVGPDHLCPECGRVLEWAEESAYRFRLSRYAPQIEALLATPGFIVPESRRNEALAFVRQGLEDIAVTRTSVAWGIPVPFDPGHTIYVWVDALSNYLTALGEAGRTAVWPCDLHVVGKDIARFHVVIWPALLLALGLPLPKQVFAHGWFNVEGAKISKSRGNGVDPVALLDRYGVDAVRYYLLRELPFGQDGNYSEAALILRTNTDLANDLGNLLSRTTQLIAKFAGGRVEKAPGASADGVLASAAGEAVAALAGHLDRLDVAGGLAAFWRLVARANKYVEEQAPWALARDPEQQERLGAVLYSLAETLRICAVALSPFLVQAPAQVYAQLGLDPGALAAARWPEALRWGGLPAGAAIRRGAPLFPRILPV